MMYTSQGSSRKHHLDLDQEGQHATEGQADACPTFPIARGGPLATDSGSQRVKLNRGSAADQGPSAFQPRDHGAGSGSNRRNTGYGGGRSYRPLNSPFKRFGGSGGEHR
ncbi:hypothetical protein BGX29_012072 [Mortierella sp. GBA35]|nr:hypothetical protein BGX29_012072 [Mortierella sp. GBA35]